MGKQRIGLALGSGSARGMSHIGIIEALEKLGVVPDIVCGCSAGAIVGGALVSGHLGDLKAWLHTLSRKDIFSFFDFALFSGGLIAGDRLFNFFRDEFGDYDIESLSLPFASVATEFPTGREIWFRSGSLLTAVRASSSLPGVITPYCFKGQWLVDGGLVNPVPVSICRAMGADSVIAVNLNGSLVKKHSVLQEEKAGTKDLTESRMPEVPAQLSDRLKKGIMDSVGNLTNIWTSNSDAPGLIDVLNATVNIMQDRITRSRMAGDPPDVILTPRLDHIGLLDFHRIEEALEEGERCVNQAADTIRAHFFQ